MNAWPPPVAPVGATPPWPPPAPRSFPPLPPPPAGRPAGRQLGRKGFLGVVAALVAVSLLVGTAAVVVAVTRADPEDTSLRSSPTTTVAPADSSTDPPAGPSTNPSTSPSPNPSAGPAGADGWDARIAPLARFVEQARGKPFRRSVPVRFLSDEDFVDQLGFQVGDAEWDDLQSATDRALGWIGPGTSSGQAWVELSEAGVAAFFDPNRGRIYFRGVPGDGALTAEVRAVLVHELTHAWQDQHVDLAEWYDDTEGGLGWQAVVEGDAMHVEHQYLATLGEDDQAAMQAWEADRRDERRSRTAVPAMFELAALAPYDMGERLVATIDAVGGDAAVDRALEMPPTTSEQVMFAAVHAAGLGSEPVASLAVPPDAALVDRRSIGAWDVFTTLITRLDGRTAALAARGWGGGEETRWETQDGAICLGWTLRADGEAAADRLVAALTAWAKAGPAGAATVMAPPLGWGAQMVMCDRGAPVPPPDTANVEDSMAWLLLHQDVVAALIGESNLPQADCAATKVLDELAPGDLSAARLAADHNAFVAAGRRALASCAGTTAVVG